MTKHKVVAKVIKARGDFDRRLAIIEQQIVWEHSSESVRENLAAKNRLAELAELAIRIGEDLGATPTVKLRSISVARECIEAASSIRTSTIIDRTIPSLSRSEVSAVLANFPHSESENAVIDKRTDEQVAREESIALLHGVIARLSVSVENGSRPGLVMIRREA